MLEPVAEERSPEHAPVIVLSKQVPRLQEAEFEKHARDEFILDVVFRTICSAKTSFVLAEAWQPVTGPENAAVLIAADKYFIETAVDGELQSALEDFRLASMNLNISKGCDLAGRAWAYGTGDWISDVSCVPASVFSRCNVARESGVKAAMSVPTFFHDGSLHMVLVFYSLRPMDKSSAVYSFALSVTQIVNNVAKLQVRPVPDVSLHFNLVILNIYLDTPFQQRSKEEVSTAAKALTVLPFFQRFPFPARVQLCRYARRRCFLRNQQLLKEGESGTCCLVILSGMVAVTDPLAFEKTCLLSAGDSLGDSALFQSPSIRVVSAVAVGEVDMLVIDRGDFPISAMADIADSSAPNTHNVKPASSAVTMETHKRATQQCIDANVAAFQLLLQNRSSMLKQLRELRALTVDSAPLAPSLVSNPPLALASTRSPASSSPSSPAFPDSTPPSLFPRPLTPSSPSSPSSSNGDCPVLPHTSGSVGSNLDGLLNPSAPPATSCSQDPSPPSLQLLWPRLRLIHTPDGVQTHPISTAPAPPHPKRQRPSSPSPSSAPPVNRTQPAIPFITPREPPRALPPPPPAIRRRSDPLPIWCPPSSSASLTQCPTRASVDLDCRLADQSPSTGRFWNPPFEPPPVALRSRSLEKRQELRTPEPPIEAARRDSPPAQAHREQVPQFQQQDLQRQTQHDQAENCQPQQQGQYQQQVQPRQLQQQDLQQPMHGRAAVNGQQQEQQQVQHRDEQWRPRQHHAHMSQLQQRHLQQQWQLQHMQQQHRPHSKRGHDTQQDEDQHSQLQQRSIDKQQPQQLPQDPRAMFCEADARRQLSLPGETAGDHRSPSEGQHGATWSLEMRFKNVRHVAHIESDMRLTSLGQVERLVQAHFKDTISPDLSVFLSYLDDDNDWIVLSREADWRECVQISHARLNQPVCIKISLARHYSFPSHLASGT